MPFTKFTNLDFDQIKTSIKDYLRSNSEFSDFDFEGSNFSVLIDTLAYNTYINAFNSNMIVNESFLDSATLRENVVSLARNIGYVPRSRTASSTTVTFTVESKDSTAGSMTLQRGLVCVGNRNDTSYVFSIPEDVTVHTSPISGGGRSATFENLKIYQGLYLTQRFKVDTSIRQRFILSNSSIDTSLLKVYVNEVGDGFVEGSLGTEHFPIDNIVSTSANSTIYLLQEVQDEKYEVLFGDGLIGKKVGNNAVITANYIVTDGKDGNGARDFSFAGTIKAPSTQANEDIIVSISSVSGLEGLPSSNGGDIETIESIKNYAPRLYSSQNRAVTSNDYENLIKKIYPNTESVSVVGGEEMDPPQYGNVQISIKPKNGFFVSDFDKTRILTDLKKYSISGINQKIVDLKVLFVETDSAVYYDDTKTTTASSLKTKILSTLTNYANSLDLNKFGGRFKYSKVLGIIDNTSNAITSNITKVKIRRNLIAFLNQSAQYELCFGNKFHVKPEGYNIKSSGFNISGETSTVYLTDVPNSDKRSGILSIIKILSTGEVRVVAKSAGTIDYEKGEINLTTVNITSTVKENNIIEIEAIPESNDIVGLRDLYINFDLSKSKINMVKDVISSGEEISGSTFIRNSYTSSYSNGTLIRE
jgi:hypothetical protein|tara:strand:+ start:516 stop:2450 length:1935 start_codon:yes stop_codon:yes gene_type:complete